MYSGLDRFVFSLFKRQSNSVGVKFCWSSWFSNFLPKYTFSSSLLSRLSIALLNSYLFMLHGVGEKLKPLVNSSYWENFSFLYFALDLILYLFDSFICYFVNQFSNKIAIVIFFLFIFSYFFLLCRFFYYFILIISQKRARYLLLLCKK